MYIYPVWTAPLLKMLSSFSGCIFDFFIKKWSVHRYMDLHLQFYFTHHCVIFMPILCRDKCIFKSTVLFCTQPLQYHGCNWVSQLDHSQETQAVLSHLLLFLCICFDIGHQNTFSNSLTILIFESEPVVEYKLPLNLEPLALDSQVIGLQTCTTRTLWEFFLQKAESRCGWWQRLVILILGE